MMDKLHEFVDFAFGVVGISEKLYALLGHGRWKDLLSGVVDDVAMQGGQTRLVNSKVGVPADRVGALPDLTVDQAGGQDNGDNR